MNEFKQARDEYESTPIPEELEFRVRASMERAGERYRENEAAFEQGAEEVHPVPQNAPAPQDGQGDASPNDFSAGAEVTPASAENAQDAPAERLQRRYLICPRCGEKIWL